MSAPELQPHTTDDLGHFVKGWIRNPLAIGALAPSGKSLAKLMAKDVGPGARVVELGAGTGTVTAALLANGVAPGDLHLVERDPQFVKILKRRFPRCHVVAADALELDRPLDAAAFDFVVSGLPLLCFSPDKRARLLEQGLQLLKPQGRLHQFTYAGRCPIDRDVRAELRVESSLLGIAALNLPPAFVYRFTRRAAASAGRSALK
ncbi:MAG TPA: methyltransferase domain-containing protein [Gammaproteobacteria bacterium]|nr:methyltransferase domain-containing protein [Gammaproteobacteria bacterium]